MAKKKVNPVQAMQDQVQSMAKGLGVEIKFEGDKGLDAYKRGKPLTMGEVYLAATEKRPVWVYYKEGEDEDPRIDSAKHVQITNGCFMFVDGSSFASEMEISLDHHPAEDDCCGEGEMKVYEAIKK